MRNSAVTCRRRALAVFAAAGAAAALPGCASPTRLAAVPRGSTGTATVFGLPNERFLPTEPGGLAALQREFLAALQRLKTTQGLPAAGLPPPLDLLGISGGGEDGAFGAGLLNGWTERGGRPEFSLVTGVSTGALSAPFAFLGSDWDAKLRSVYTDITLADVLVPRAFTAAIWDDGMADNSPLFLTISRYLDETMLTEIARAYQAGRLLLIGTSNLDAQVPVIWNIGAIAASGHPRALDTVRRILLASAAVPGAFSPVLFDVTVEGQALQELHVDGGAFVQLFLYPPIVSEERRERMARGMPVTPVRAWVIRNAKLDPQWASVNRRTVPIASRAISSMIAVSGYNDLHRIHFTAQRDRVDYNLAFIGREFTATLDKPFDQAYMQSLYAYGRRRAVEGDAWVDRPPF